MEQRANIKFCVKLVTEEYYHEKKLKALPGYKNVILFRHKAALNIYRVIQNNLMSLNGPIPEGILKLSL